MAVNSRLKVGEYEAWVVVENQEIEHYGIKVDEEKKLATCWIASTVGKHFGVWVERFHQNFHCKIDVLLDGSWSAAQLGDKTWTNPTLLEDTYIGGNSVRPFLFGVLHLTDDDSFQSTKSYEELGTIKVTIRRAVDVQYQAVLPWTLQVPKADKVHERAKKSATHQVSFGEPKMADKHQFSTCKSQETVATFVFRYRSLDMLRANDIVPPDLPPAHDVPVDREPGPSKRRAVVKEEMESDVENDLEGEYNRKEAELEAELERIRKARLEHKEGRAKKRVKREPKPVFLPGEVIDLTI